MTLTEQLEKVIKLIPKATDEDLLNLLGTCERITIKNDELRNLIKNEIRKRKAEKTVSDLQDNFQELYNKP